MSQPFIKLLDVREARFQHERRTFVRRHNRVSVPWVMFCIGFALGIGLMIVAPR